MEGGREGEGERRQRDGEKKEWCKKECCGINLQKYTTLSVCVCEQALKLQHFL